MRSRDQYNNVPEHPQKYDTTPPIGGTDQQGKNNPASFNSTPPVTLNKLNE